MAMGISINAIRRRIRHHNDRIRNARAKIRQSELAIQELELLVEGAEMVNSDAPEVRDWQSEVLDYLSEPQEAKDIYQFVKDCRFSVSAEVVRKWLRRQVGTLVHRIERGVYVHAKFWDADGGEAPDEGETVH